MKKIISTLILLILCLNIFAQEEFDDFDSLFEDAGDISVEEVAPALTSVETNTENPSNQKNNSFFKPLTFSGYLEGEVGLAFLYNQKPDITGYFDFLNDLYFSARASKNLAIKGTVRTELPDFGISLRELYFDYLIFDRIYITAGKKTISWGYVRLFSNSDSYGDSTDLYGPLLTDIMTDTSGAILTQVQLPIFTGTINAVAFYKGSMKTTPSWKDFSLAGSIEMTLLNTSVNLFGRKYPSKEGNLSAQYKAPILGLEMKRTILSTDFYVQGQTSIKDFNKMNSFLGYEQFVVTGGFYRWWDNIIPKIGFNIEYQFIYMPNEIDSTAHRIAFAGGLGSLGKKKNMKIGLEWNHNVLAESGNVVLGFIVSGILPHAEWKTGLETTYGSLYTDRIPKIKLGSTIKVQMNY